MALPRYSGKEVSKYLRDLAMEAADTTPDGEVITRARKMAEILWKKALGYTETTPDRKTGELVEKYNPPEAWALTMIYERLEGRVANSAPEDSTKRSVADKVSDLARDRVNKLAMDSITVKPKGPPSLKGRK